MKNISLFANANANANLICSLSWFLRQFCPSRSLVLCTKLKFFVALFVLEGAAHYAGLCIAPVDGFCQTLTIDENVLVWIFYHFAALLFYCYIDQFHCLTMLLFYIVLHSFTCHLYSSLHQLKRLAVLLLYMLGF